MESASISEHWHDLYVMFGGSSAALLGLLFVATSLHLDKIVSNPGFRMRARNLTIHLVVTLILAAAVLTPQPIAVLGGELVAVSLCGLWLPLSFHYNAHFKNKAMGKRGGLSIVRGLTYLVAYLLALAGGAALIDQSNWGMYLLTLAYVIFIGSVVWNAWTIMVGVGLEEEQRKKAEAQR